MRYSYALGNQVPVVVLFGIFTVAYATYIYLYESQTVRRMFYTRWGDEQGSLYHVLACRGIFAALGAVLPILIAWALFDITPAAVGITLSRSNWSFSRTLLWVVLASAIAGSILWFSRKTDRLLEVYPQIRLSRWNLWAVLLNIVSWGAYLMAYEIMFRGYLLSSLLPAGIWVAIAINTTLYVAVHLPKGLSESIGAAVYGPIMCVITLESGTIWVAFVSHLVLALANSFSNLRANPNMRIIQSGSSAAIPEPPGNSI